MIIIVQRENHLADVTYQVISVSMDGWSEHFNHITD